MNHNCVGCPRGLTVEREKVGCLAFRLKCVAVSEAMRRWPFGIWCAYDKPKINEWLEGYKQKNNMLEY